MEKSTPNIVIQKYERYENYAIGMGIIHFPSIFQIFVKVGLSTTINANDVDFV